MEEQELFESDYYVVDHEVSSKQLLNTVCRRWRLILLCTCLFALAGIFYSYINASKLILPEETESTESAAPTPAVVIPENVSPDQATYERNLAIYEQNRSENERLMVRIDGALDINSGFKMDHFKTDLLKNNR